MANTKLFQSTRGPLIPAATQMNREGAKSYAYSPRHRLAQYAATGCMSNTFYAHGHEQLTEVLNLAGEVDATFIAKTAIYARERAWMKDMPALLAAVLSTKDVALLRKVFPRVIDNGRMLRNFVQILRSGAVGRKSLGSAPKGLVQSWLNGASERKLLDAAVGTNPSLADVVRMVHPKPSDRMREAFYGWLIGRPYAVDALPPPLQALTAFKFDRAQSLPDVPFQMLTALGLGRDEWAQIARQGAWHMVRMNLNTFARKGVFEIDGMAEIVAAKLRDRDAILRARVFPYQLMVAYRAASDEIPRIVKESLQDAMEIALENVPAFSGRVVVCPDVSGSMASPVTGMRRGATTAVRCIDVAALVSAAVLRANPEALVLPFAESVRKVALNPRDSVITNAQKLAALGGGGTNCSAPIAQLAKNDGPVDLVILVSDNQSWVDARATGPSETLRQWAQVRRRNPAAKLVCIDLQPYGTTQAMDRADVLNVGGFSDEVFAVIAQFASGTADAAHWVEVIEGVAL
jgi:60 kDa SS-A/Ro ribonucleoprotein